MARCQPDHLIASTQKDRIGAYNDSVDMLLNEVREGGVDIAFAAGIQGNELDAVCARRSLNVCGLGLRCGISGVDKEADNGGVRHQFTQQFQPFCPKGIDEKSHASDVTAVTVETENETEIDHTSTHHQEDWRG